MLDYIFKLSVSLAAGFAVGFTLLLVIMAGMGLL